MRTREDSMSLMLGDLGDRYQKQTVLGASTESTSGGSGGGGDMEKATYDTDADGKVNSAVAADDAAALGGYAASQYPRKGVANTFTAAQTATAWETTLAGYVATPSVAYLDNSGVTNLDIAATNTSGTLLWDKQGGAGTYAVQFSANLNLGFFGAAPVARPTVSAGNANGEVGGLAVGATYSQLEVQALRDKTEEVADDLRSLRAALVQLGLVQE